MTTPRDIAAWEARMKRERGWSRCQCYQALGVSFDRYRRMREGSVPVRAHIGLAMTALVRGLEPYGVD